MAFPKIDACVVCEAVRPELFGKHILLGFFGITPHAQVSLKDALQPAMLCFVFCGGGGEGRFDLNLRITDSQQIAIANPVGATVSGELINEKNSTTAFMPFNGVFGKYGTYNVYLLVNGAEHYQTTIAIAPFKPAQARIQ